MMITQREPHERFLGATYHGLPRWGVSHRVGVMVAAHDGARTERGESLGQG